jgi:methyl-accepting chemotaxis protein
MENKHNLLIVEKSSSALTAVASENKDYVLEGVFGQIDQKNKNNRIYTESEYLPQIEALQAKIASSKLLGELDHPTTFDTSLKNVSHIIEELFYDKETKEVRGKIRLLDTDAGRQAKALVDAGVPLQISSRAAGAVESNGEVKIKQLFTYDLVADPGFENAELIRVNESYGYSNDETLFIYEMHKLVPTVVEKIENTNTNIQIKENQTMADFVKAEDFNKYSEYLANEIKSLKESIGDKTVTEESDIKNVKAHNNHIVENVKTLSEYVEYLAEKLDNSIQYSEHVAEKADQGISYAEHVAEKLDDSISYTEHISEAVAKVKDFANYLAEAHNEGVDTKENLVAYVEYLKENLQAVSEYTEYIAESLNEEVIEVNTEAEEG